MTEAASVASRAIIVFAAAVLVLGSAVTARAADHPNQTLPYGEVDWGRGFVRVSAVGLPPMAGGSSDAARQNAVTMAQKRLLGVILDMDGRGGKLREQIGKRPDLKTRLRHLVTSADLRGKAFTDGSVEVTLTVATDGPAGLKALLREF